MPNVTFGVGAALQGIGSIYSAKQQASAAKYVAKLQADATNSAAVLSDSAAKRSLGFMQHQSFRDEVRAIAAAKAQYGADVAGQFNSGETSAANAYNQRAEYLSSGRTASKERGQRTNQMNYLRDLLGYGQPQESLDTFVEPDALRRAQLIVPKEMDYGDAPVDDSLDPLTGQPRYR